jgi:hypothetical protein
MAIKLAWNVKNGEGSTESSPHSVSEMTFLSAHVYQLLKVRRPRIPTDANSAMAKKPLRTNSAD